MNKDRATAVVSVGGVVPSITMHIDLKDMPVKMKLELFASLYRDLEFVDKLSMEARREIDVTWAAMMKAA